MFWYVVAHVIFLQDLLFENPFEGLQKLHVSSLGRSLAAFGLSWLALGRSWGALGSLLAALGASKSVFKRHFFKTCDVHKIVLKPAKITMKNDSPGRSWGALGSLLGRSWPLWGRSWAALGPLLAALGSLLGRSGALLGSS